MANHYHNGIGQSLPTVMVGLPIIKLAGQLLPAVKIALKPNCYIFEQ